MGRALTDAAPFAGTCEALDERGFVVLPGLLADGELSAARAAFERVVRDERSGTRHAEATLFDEPDLDFAFAHPSLLAAAEHVLAAPLVLFVLNARDPLPGYGAQGLHADWTPRATHDPMMAMTALWMLDDFTEANGATRVVPGTHRIPGAVPRGFAQPDSRHPKEERALGAAGSLLLFNGHLWHAGGRNASDGSRRALQVQLAARRFARPGAGVGKLPSRVPAELRARLSAEAAS